MPEINKVILGGLEAGGTKMVLCTGDMEGNLLEQVSIPTLAPEETCIRMIEWFKDKGISALGIASFGPIQLDPARPLYGSILSTPKPGWGNFPLLDTLKNALQVPCCIDTDVNGAALAQVQLGAAKGCRSCLYLTIGTGIGGGLYAEGQLIHGRQHPEWGHMLLQSAKNDPCPEGFCPYHQGCLQGLASGPAIEKRWGKPARELPEDHPAWQLEAEYLAQACMTAFMTFSPEKILLGGGVMAHPGLLEAIRKRTREMINGYLDFEAEIDGMIDVPALYPLSGAYGALILAKEAAKSAR